MDFSAHVKAGTAVHQDLKLPQRPEACPAHVFIDAFIAETKRELLLHWRSDRSPAELERNLEDSTAISFLRTLRSATNSDATLSPTQQSFLKEHLSGEDWFCQSQHRIEGGADPGYWERILPIATYINSCRG